MQEKLLTTFRQLISEQTGLNIRDQDIDKFAGIISARIKFLRLPAPDEYYELLKTDSGKRGLEWKEIITRLTTGETYFFRDKGQFSLLRLSILPKLIELQKEKKTLRIWSAGCSTGEEAYSLAILVNELIPDRRDWNVLILGTDINEDAINKAKTGRYGQWSFRHVDEEIKRQYFKKVKNEWAIDEGIKDMVRFDVMNLLKIYPDYGTGAHDMDLILCRNVFIYFRQEVVSEVVEKMTAALGDGGYLVTGHAEIRGQNFPSLQAKVFPESVVYQKISDFGFRIAELKPEIPKTEVQTKKTKITEKAQPKTDVEISKSAIRNTQSKMELARAYADMGRHEEAIKICEETIKTDPFPPAPYFLLSQIAREKGDIETEKEMLKKVIYLDPSHIASFLNLAILYDSEGDNEKASKMRDTALELLKALPSDARIEPYTEIAVEELIKHIQAMLK